MFYYSFESINYELELIIKEIGIKNIEEYLERLNSFLTKIFQRQIYKENIIGFLEAEETKKMVYLSSEELRFLLSNQYNIILNKLKSKNLIKIHEIHSGYGKFYKLIALTSKTLSSIKKSSNLTHKRVINGLNKYYLSKHKSLTGINKKVFSNLCKFKINITKEEIIEELHKKYPIYKKEKLEYYNNLATKKEKNKKYKILSLNEYMDQFKYLYEYIQLWNNSCKIEKMAFVSIDKFGNRFHSIFTTLPSFIRKYTKAKDFNNIISLDLKQSQPTILSKIIYDKYGDNEFTDAVNNGDIYSLYPYSRKNAKAKFLRGIFANKHSNSFHELNQLFPSAGKTILELQKEKMYKGDEVLSCSKNTSCTLQRTESRIFRKIWDKLIFHDIRFINVHDCLYVDSSNKELVLDLFKGVLNTELAQTNYSINITSLTDIT